jgi:hypothetical protein
MRIQPRDSADAEASSGATCGCIIKFSGIKSSSQRIERKIPASPTDA